MKDEVRGKFWGGQLDAVLEEIARNSLICGVRVLDPGVIERVLKDDDTVCGQKNPIAFRKLRELLILGFVTRGTAFDKLGAVEAETMVVAMRERLKERFGGKLGGAPGGAAG